MADVEKAYEILAKAKGTTVEEEKEKSQDVPEYVKRYMKKAEEERTKKPHMPRKPCTRAPNPYVRAPYVSTAGMSDKDRTAEKARRKAETMDIVARKYATKKKKL
jgi:molybdopterin-biosynthesis enzyme MoeA-like protein|nr:MAG TPA: hypothetical protein [Caudoviricetes sp.]